jgi:hypothetical protein
MNLALETAHPALKLFALAPNARELLLLRAKPGVTRFLRARLTGGYEANGDDKDEAPQMRRR